MIVTPWVRLPYQWPLWPFSMVVLGGYAFFGPGVYGDSDIYSKIIQPVANFQLFFAGEATSACHAYVDLLPILWTFF